MIKFLSYIIFLFSIISFSVVQLFSAEEYESATEWNKYYEPIESPGVMQYVEKCFTEAQRLFGKPIQEVNEIHLRQSITRKNFNTFSRAEIHDWQNLAKSIYYKRDNPSYSYLWMKLDAHAQNAFKKLIADKPLDYLEKIRIINNFNRMIKSENFYNEQIFSQITTPKKGFSLRRLLSSRKERFQSSNRSIITKLFPNSILPAPKLKRISEGIELCECTDKQRGIFTIFIPSPPTKEDFYLEVAHEATHLLNTDFFDWYVEGMNNVFAQHMAKITNHDWTPWRRLFNNGEKSQPYAISYFMMREVMQVVGTNINGILAHKVAWGRDHKKMRIEINSWLATLPKEQRHKVINIITQFAPRLNANKGRRNAFVAPGN